MLAALCGLDAQPVVDSVMDLAHRRLISPERAWPRPSRMAIGVGERGADLAGVGMPQVLEDDERLLPGLPGLR